MKIFIVTSGQYSDYTIEAVFTSKALAERLVASYFPAKDGRIEEYEADALEGHLKRGLVEYMVHMNLDGSNASARPSLSLVAAHERCNFLYMADGIFPERLYAEIATTSAKRAIKILNERRSQFLADGRYGDQVRKS